MYSVEDVTSNATDIANCIMGNKRTKYKMRTSILIMIKMACESSKYDRNFIKELECTIEESQRYHD